MHFLFKQTYIQITNVFHCLFVYYTDKNGVDKIYINTLIRNGTNQLYKWTIDYLFKMKDFVEILDGSISTDVGEYVPIKRGIKLCLMRLSTPRICTICFLTHVRYMWSTWRSSGTIGKYWSSVFTFRCIKKDNETTNSHNKLTPNIYFQIPPLSSVGPFFETNQIRHWLNDCSTFQQDLKTSSHAFINHLLQYAYTVWMGYAELRSWEWLRYKSRPTTALCDLTYTPVAFWILLQTSLFVTWFLYEMFRII